MKIGNLYAKVDRDKEYTPDEILEIIGGDEDFPFFAYTILYNNNDYHFLPTPIFPVINSDNKTFHLELPDSPDEDEDEELLEELQDIISGQVFDIKEDFNIKYFKPKYRDNFCVSLVEEVKNDGFRLDIVYNDKNDVDTALIRHHFKGFLELTQTNTFRKLLAKVNEAREIFNNESPNEPFQDPFEIEDSDFFGFRYI